MDSETTLVFLNTMATVSSGLIAVYFAVLIWIMTMEKYKNVKMKIIEAMTYGILIEGFVMVLCFQYLIGQLNELYSLNYLASQLLFFAFLGGIIIPGILTYKVVNEYSINN